MGGIVSLSKRMQAAADLVSAGNRVCDVGCDHGYVSIYLVQSGKSPGVIAMDINEGPLLRAREHVRKYHVEDYITLRLSDGLCAYREGEADTLLCAGMGGRLMMEILKRDWHKTGDFTELVLQPQSEIPLFRKFLREKGYIFIEEAMVLEEGKFYPLMKVKYSPKAADKAPEDCGRPEGEGDGPLKDAWKGICPEDMLGPLLLKEKNPVLYQFIRREISQKQEILSHLMERAGKEALCGRRQELEWELALLLKAKEQLSE